MHFLLAFLFAGLVCALGQIILDNTKLTPGHITSLFTAGGAILSFLGIYDNLIEKFGAGALLLISNFGHSLYTGALNGYYENGFLGILQNTLSNSSAIICGAIISAFLLTIFFKPKN